NPYAFLDGGEIQERRARAVNTRRSLTVESVSDLGRLDPLAIEQVRREALPLIRDGDELHDTLLSRFALPAAEGLGYEQWFGQLVAAGRATTISVTPPIEDEPAPPRPEHSYWVPAERLPAVKAAYPHARLVRDLPVPEGVATDWSDIDARIALVRGYLDFCGP